MRGSTLAGRYRMEELLGAGGMGEVWRAVDERLGRPVAVKVIARPGDAQLAERLRREARAAAAVNDPHVVTVHDTGEAQLGGRAVVYLVMELVEGTPLNRVLERGLPAVANVVRWGRQICSALEAAHSAGVVHRDVKPANVLLTGTGKIKLCDFGIARRPGGDRLTGAGMVVGTPSYMSPEQIRGQQVGPGSDLYSLGCLLYELLTGTLPFPGGTAALAQHIEQAPEPVRSRRPEVPEALERVVMELLAKDPGRRPASAAETRRRLAAASRRGGPAYVPAVAPVTAPLTVVDQAVTRTGPAPVGRTRQPAMVRRPGRPVARASALTGVLVGGQLAAFSALSAPAAAALGAAAAGLLAVGYLLETRPGAAPRSEEGPGTATGLFVALAVAMAAALVLLVASPAPWWAAVLAATVTGPVLVTVAAGVRGLVEQLLARADLEADLASTVGLLCGAVSCALLAAQVRSPVLAVTAGAGVWVVCAVIVGSLLPPASHHRLREAPQH